MVSVEPWIVIVFAPFVGSFLAVVIVRLPADEPLILDRSRCPKCKHRLSVLELVPFASWVIQKGRCRHCGEAIGYFYPCVEVAALFIAVWAAAVVDGWLLLPTCVLGWFLLALAVIDVRHLILPDELTLPLLLLGLVTSAFLPAAHVVDHAIGAVAGLIAFVGVALAYKSLRGRDGLGYGDAKLIAASGAWLSWTGLASVILGAAVLALAVALLERVSRASRDLDRPIPFGPYLAAATWYTWLYGPFVLKT